jgi:hypothetical protein
LETRGYLNLTDDLLTPVKYSTNTTDRHNAGTDQLPKTSATDNSERGFVLPCFVVPVDNTRVVVPYRLLDYEQLN